MFAVKNIALRYLSFMSSSKSVMAMTIITVIGIAIGVATLTVTLSVAGGFDEAYKKSILDFNAHVVLLSTKEIDNVPEKLKKIDQYRMSADAQEAADHDVLTVKFIELLRSLWFRLDLIYYDAQMSDYGNKLFLEFIDTFHPRVVAHYLYSKDLYPKNIVNSIAKILIDSRGYVVGASPFLYREGLMIHNGLVKGVVIKGVDFDALSSVSEMKFDRDENVTAAGSESEDGLISIYIGAHLFDELELKPGDMVSVMLPEKWEESKAGKFQQFRIAGKFESGMYDFDSQFTLVDLKDAQKVFNREGIVNGIEIKLDDADNAPLFAMVLERDLAYPHYASSWQELNRSLFEAVKLEKLMFIIIMGALVVVAAFNIIGTIMLRILYKTSDISILRALGMDKKSLKKIFILQGMMVGGLGTLIGMLLAVLLIWSLAYFEWLKIPPEIYLLERLPVCISWSASVIIAAFSMLVCYMTSLVASKKVLELQIVKGLHRP